MNFTFTLPPPTVSDVKVIFIAASAASGPEGEAEAPPAERNADGCHRRFGRAQRAGQCRRRISRPPPRTSPRGLRSRAVPPRPNELYFYFTPDRGVDDDLEACMGLSAAAPQSPLRGSKEKRRDGGAAVRLPRTRVRGYRSIAAAGG